MSKLTSDWVKNRWATAREKKAFYSEKFGEDISVREFYKNENPLISKIVTYEVSIDMSYQGANYEFFSPQETFKVTSVSGLENKEKIEEATKTAVSEIFKGGARSWIYDNVNVEARGIEKTEVKYNSDKYKELLNKTYSLDEVPKFEVGKGRTQASSNKNKYNLDIWL